MMILLASRLSMAAETGTKALTVTAWSWKCTDVVALPEYTADWDDEEKINSIVQREAGTTAWHRVKAPLPVPCLVALRMGTPPGIVNHTGVYIGHGKFIHTRAKIGVCVSRIDSPAWRGVIDGFYEYVGDKL